MRIPSFILGYHGCDQVVAEQILVGEQEVQVSKNQHDWLGSGAYFWENSPRRALSWAQSLADQGRPKSQPVQTPAVVGAVIDPGNCLDLAEESSLALVKTAFEGFKRLCKRAEVPLPKNESGFTGDADLVKRHLDCAVVNFLHHTRKQESFPAFDTVRAPFLEGSALFDGSKLVEKCHVQWSVLSPKKSVIAYFRPRDPEAAEA